MFNESEAVRGGPADRRGSSRFAYSGCDGSPDRSAGTRCRRRARRAATGLVERCHFGARPIAIAAIVTLLFGSAAFADHPRPNVIFILLDDLGWGDLARFGHPKIRTPSINRIMTNGTTFTQFYACSGVCSPSRAAFMTGQFPGRLGIHRAIDDPGNNVEFLDPQVLSVTQAFHDAGYATALYGKWHLGRGKKKSPSPSEYGIDEHMTSNSNGPRLPDNKFRYFRALSTQIMVNQAIEFMDANRGTPVFINLWTMLPHSPLDPTPEQLEQYKGLGSEEAVRYYASVTAADAAIGRLLNYVFSRFIARKTIIVVASDNGPVHPGSNGPFRGIKRSLYEGGIRVPFVVQWRDHVPDNHIDNDTLMAGVDFLPTLCALAGVDLPDGLPLDGEDMSDVILSGVSRPRTTPLFWQWRFAITDHVLHRSPVLAVREGPWKLLLNMDGSRHELYDIPADPSELNNMALDQPQLVSRLSQMALTWAQTLPEGEVEPGAGRNDYPWPQPRPTQE